MRRSNKDSLESSVRIQRHRVPREEHGGLEMRTVGFPRSDIEQMLPSNTRVIHIDYIVKVLPGLYSQFHPVFRV